VIGTSIRIEFQGLGGDAQFWIDNVRLTARPSNAVTNPPPSSVFDLSEGFSAANNPNGPWTYGWESTLGGAFTALTVPHVSTADGGVQVPSWQLTSFQTPAVYKNTSGHTISVGGGQASYPDGTVWYFPGENGRPENFGLIRFTAPSNGAYRVETAVAPVYPGPPQGDTDFHVLKNGAELFGRFLATSDTASFAQTVVLAIGDTIDFAIGRGADGSQYGSGLQIRATLTPTTSPPPLDCVPPASGLVAWWPLNGDARDAVHGDTGALGGHPVFGDGMVAQGLQFDGVDDHIRVPASAALDAGAGAGVTIELWLKPADLNPPSALLEWSTTVGPQPGLHLFTSVSSAGSLFANLIDVDVVAHHFSSPGGVLTAGIFQHIAFTYDRASGVARFYVNGALVAEDTIGSLRVDTRPDLWIGQRPLNGPDYFFRGTMDEISLYNRALSAGEIQAIHQAGAAGKCSLPPPLPPGNFDLSAGFSAANNPNGPWAYGWEGTLGGAFTALTVPHISTADGGVQVPSWQLTSFQTPAVYKNTSGQTITIAAGRGSLADGAVWYFPGENGRPENFGVIRFTAPSNGAYRVQTAVAPIYSDALLQADADFHVLRNGEELFGRFLAPGESADFAETVLLASGDTIDFAIGRGADGSQVNSGLQIRATLTASPAPPQPPSSDNFDLSAGFSAANNPNGPWAYGWEGALGGAFTALTVPHISTADGGVQVPSWQLTSFQTPAVYKNTSGHTISVGGGQASYPDGTMWYFPGENGRPENFGVIRFTAPSNGAYHVEASVAPVYPNSPPQGDTDFHVLKNGIELFGRFLATSQSASFTRTVILAAGDTIDFAIGRGADGNQYGSGLQIRATLTATPIPPHANHGPLAKAEIKPVFEVWPDEPSFLVIAANGVEAVVSLDGSGSSDADNDALDYLWIENGQASPFAAGIRVTNSFGLGEHAVTLLVSDGQDTGHDTVTFEVITLSDAVNELILLLTETEVERRNKRPLLVTLNAAWESFEDGDLEAGVKRLRVFQQKVRAQVANSNPEAAAKLIAGAQQIIDAVEALPDEDHNPKGVHQAQ
jgi:hypothetical protein